MAETLPRDANSVVSEIADANGNAAPAHEDVAGDVLSAVALLGYGEDALINALAITDTAAHSSAASDCRGYKCKCLFVTSTLNQAVTVTYQVSRDNASWVSIQASPALAAGSYVAMGDETGQSPGNSAFLNGLANPWPYLRVQAQCSVAPTAGSLSVWLEKLAG